MTKTDRVRVYYNIHKKCFSVQDYKTGQTINLTGYISSSRQKSVAIKFALSNLKPDQIPAVFQIEFTGDQGLF
mgnify:CR=1 FL=1